MERSGRGAAWLARLLGVQEVPGSNPGGPTKSIIGSNLAPFSLRHHANVTIVLQCLFRDMANYVHDRLIACAALCLRVVTGLVGSLGRGLPNAKPYYSGRTSPKRSLYQAA
jgi:hypothetical protein